MFSVNKPSPFKYVTDGIYFVFHVIVFLLERNQHQKPWIWCDKFCYKLFSVKVFHDSFWLKKPLHIYLLDPLYKNGVNHSQVNFCLWIFILVFICQVHSVALRLFYMVVSHQTAAIHWLMSAIRSPGQWNLFRF